MPNEIPRDHPLWPAFQEWAKTRIGSQTMRALWWECFLAGAGAHEHYQKDQFEKRVSEIVSDPTKVE